MAIEVAVIDKHPNDDIPYTFDFGAWSSLLAVSALASATATADIAGLTIGSPTVSGYTVSVRISGGTDGVTYRLTVTATTVDNYDIVSLADLNVYIP